jgi:hypothetical protein
MLQMLCLLHHANAKDKPIDVKSNNTVRIWNLDAGANIGIPIRQLHALSVLGISGDFSATTEVYKNLSVGGRAELAYFIGRTSNGSNIPNVILINLLGDVNYMLPQKIMVGIDLGLGRAFSKWANYTKFARIFYLGHEWVEKKRTYTLSLFFDQTTWQKNLGIRGTIRL